MQNKINSFTMMVYKLSAILLAIALNATFAQIGMPKDLVKIETYQSFDKVYPGSEFKLALEALLRTI